MDIQTQEEIRVLRGFVKTDKDSRHNTYIILKTKVEKLRPLFLELERKRIMAKEICPELYDEYVQMFEAVHFYMSEVTGIVE